MRSRIGSLMCSIAASVAAIDQEQTSRPPWPRLTKTQASRTIAGAFMDNTQVVIAAATRTPIGAFQGVLAPASATQLGAAAIRGALASAKLAPADVQEVVMGCVLPAGLGQAPARQASLGAGIPTGVPTTTINKMC